MESTQQIKDGERSKEASLAALAALHLGANIGIKGFHHTPAGRKFQREMAAKGLVAGMKGQDLPAVQSQLMRGVVGPELTTEFDVGKSLGKKWLAGLSERQAVKKLKKTRQGFVRAAYIADPTLGTSRQGGMTEALGKMDARSNVQTKSLAQGLRERLGHGKQELKEYATNKPSDILHAPMMQPLIGGMNHLIENPKNFDQTSNTRLPLVDKQHQIFATQSTNSPSGRLARASPRAAKALESVNRAAEVVSDKTKEISPIPISGILGTAASLAAGNSAGAVASALGHQGLVAHVRQGLAATDFSKDVARAGLLSGMKDEKSSPIIQGVKNAITDFGLSPALRDADKMGQSIALGLKNQGVKQEHISQIADTLADHRSLGVRTVDAFNRGVREGGQYLNIPDKKLPREGAFTEAIDKTRESLADKMRDAGLRIPPPKVNRAPLMSKVEGTRADTLGDRIRKAVMPSEATGQKVIQMSEAIRPPKETTVLNRLGDVAKNQVSVDNPAAAQQAVRDAANKVKKIHSLLDPVAGGTQNPNRNSVLQSALEQRGLAARQGAKNVVTVPNATPQQSQSASPAQGSVQVESDPIREFASRRAPQPSIKNDVVDVNPRKSPQSQTGWGHIRNLFSKK